MIKYNFSQNSSGLKISNLEVWKLGFILNSLFNF